MSLVYLDIKQIFFSIIAVTISGKIISIIYKRAITSSPPDAPPPLTTSPTPTPTPIPANILAIKYIILYINN